MKLVGAIVCLMLVGGCAMTRPDHFYVLSSGNARALDPRAVFATQVTLSVTLPVLVDRSEIVLINPDGIRILEHERWGAPLDDQFTITLGQDIEARREDVIMASRRIAQPGVRTATISVEVVRLALRRGSDVQLEARWRSEDGGKASQRRETFVASPADDTILAMTRSVDVCIGLLADRLVADLAR